jgi:hypothetical protein
MSAETTSTLPSSGRGSTDGHVLRWRCRWPAKPSPAERLADLTSMSQLLVPSAARSCRTTGGPAYRPGAVGRAAGSPPSRSRPLGRADPSLRARPPVLVIWRLARRVTRLGETQLTERWPLRSSHTRPTPGGQLRPSPVNSGQALQYTLMGNSLAAGFRPGGECGASWNRTSDLTLIRGAL